jgi:multidrug resistance efflux pump
VAIRAASKGGFRMSTPATATTPNHWTPPRKGRTVVIVIVVLVVVALLAVARAWGWLPFSSGETTEDAYVRGRTTVIAPQVSGYVVEVLVRDYQRVHAGDVLVRIDDRSYAAKVEQARANLQAAMASLANNEQAHSSSLAALKGQEAGLQNASAQLLRAKADMERAKKLVDDGSVSIRERDQTAAALALGEAQVRQADAAREQAHQAILTVEVARGGLEAAVAGAKAQLDAAQIDLDHTVIRAAETGQLGEVGVRLGQFVTNGTQLMSLVPDERWVIANYKEAQTAHIAVGQPATFAVDALDGATLKGRVEQLSPATGSEFAVLKPDNATGNFVKVPQRIGVRISVDGPADLAARLRPGMSVVAHIDTHAKP